MKQPTILFVPVQHVKPFECTLEAVLNKDGKWLAQHAPVFTNELSSCYISSRSCASGLTLHNEWFT